MNATKNDAQQGTGSDEPTSLRTLVVKRDAPFGVTLSAEVSPCSWMYQMPFQLRVSMEDKGGDIIIRDPNLRFENATADDMHRLLGAVQLVQCKCKGCSNPAFDPKVHDTNRAGQCESCFMTKLNAQFAKEKAKEDAKLAKLDAKYKSQGYTHRVDMWVHAGGDDVPVSMWMKNPTDEQIQAELKKRKSLVLTDYQKIVL